MTELRPRQVAHKVFEELAQLSSEESIRLSAATKLKEMDEEAEPSVIVAQERWYDVSLKSLTEFFLKCVVAALPAAGLCIVLYVLAYFTAVVMAAMLQ